MLKFTQRETIFDQNLKESRGNFWSMQKRVEGAEGQLNTLAVVDRFVRKVEKHAESGMGWGKIQAC